MIVDQTAAVVELLSEQLRERTSCSVRSISDARAAVAFAQSAASDPPAIAIVDFLDPYHACNGLDVMMAFRRWCPESAVILYTQGGHCVEPFLAVVWEAMRPASVVSKLSPVRLLYATIDDVLRCGAAEVDPRLRSLLPSERSPWRTVDGYRRLANHAGHAKVWLALLQSDRSPTYRQIAERAGLSVNTIRNYRDDLLGELRLHGLQSPTMRQMHAFAHSIRPLLHPVLEERLGGRAETGGDGARAKERSGEANLGGEQGWNWQPN